MRFVKYINVRATENLDCFQLGTLNTKVSILMVMFLITCTIVVFREDPSNDEVSDASDGGEEDPQEKSWTSLG